MVVENPGYDRAGAARRATVGRVGRVDQPYRQHVFERFYQAGNDGTNGGSGLGLAIVAAVVKAHDGDVTVLPGSGTGCRFLVRIPAG